MEHIIQFAVSVEDEAIRRTVERNGAAQVIRNITDDVERRLFESDWRGKRFTEFAQAVLDAWFERNKDEIIAFAGKEVAAKFARSKAGKAIMETIKEAGENGTNA